MEIEETELRCKEYKDSQRFVVRKNGMKYETDVIIRIITHITQEDEGEQMGDTA